MTHEPVLHRPINTKLKWADEFDGDLSKWRTDGLVVSGDHRTGNKYLRPDGTIDMARDWHELPGRYAALCDDYRDECQFVKDGNLIIKGHAVETPNPYRVNFTDYYGILHPYGDWRLYGAWLESLETIERGSVIEFRVDLGGQSMRNHRFSFWLVSTDGRMYEQSVYWSEIDLLEAQDDSRVDGSTFKDKGLMKIVGGDAGDTPNGLVDFTRDDLKTNIRNGWHAFTLVWNHDGSLEFLCDGKLCNSDGRIVGMKAMIIISDEMCSGVKSLKQADIDAFNAAQGRDGKDPSGDDDPLLTLDDFNEYLSLQSSDTEQGRANINQALKVVKPWENYTTGPKMPRDDGLTGQSVILDVDQMGTHHVKIDYVRVYDIVEGPIMKKPDDPASPINPTPPADTDMATKYQSALAKIETQADFISDQNLRLDAQDGIITELTESIESARAGMASLREFFK